MSAQPTRTELLLKAPGALVIWIFLLLVSNFGLLLGLLSLLTFRTDYISRIFKAHDRSAAAVLGFEGDHTVSWECGRSTCRFCKLICRLASFLLRQKNHCAEYEGE